MKWESRRDQEAPLFTEACPDGKCAKCGGQQFRPRKAVGTAFLRGGLIGATGIAGNSARMAECVTCGARYRRGQG